MAENRFSLFVAKKPAPKKAKKVPVRQAVAEAEVLVSEDAPAKAKIDPAVQKQMLMGRGFRLVEGKKKQPRKKRPSSDDEAEEAVDSVPSIFHRPPPPAHAESAGAKQQRPPRRNKGIPGATVIDEAEQRREKKAIRSLQKHLAKQVVKPVMGDITLPRKRREEEAEEELPELPKAAHQVLTVPPKQQQQQQQSTWAATEALQPSAQQQQTAQQKKQKGGAWPGKQQQQPQQQKSGGKKGVQHFDPSDPIKINPPVVVHAPSAAAKDSAADAGPQVEFFFVFPDKTKASLADPTALVTKAKVRVSEAVASVLARQLPLKGGLFVEVETKSWSNEATVDEPWMVISYYKALAQLLKNRKAEVRAYPYWPVIEGPRKKDTQDAEAEVKLRCVPPDYCNIELEHADQHCKSRVNLKSIRLPFDSFVDALVRNGNALVAVIAEVEALLEKMIVGGADDKQKFDQLIRPLPRGMTALMDEINSLVAAK